MVCCIEASHPYLILPVEGEEMSERAVETHAVQRSLFQRAGETGDENMMTSEENELLTKTDPGTPAGELIRRYWQPVALAEELPAGGVPLSVRILGEELVLFRDDQGRVGLWGFIAPIAARISVTGG